MMMTITELLKQLTDNLTDEQKSMPARYADTDGHYYEIDGMFVVSKSTTESLPEGQVVLACFGIDD
jgi:hypothetical protein